MDINEMKFVLAAATFAALRLANSPSGSTVRGAELLMLLNSDIDVLNSAVEPTGITNEAASLVAMSRMSSVYSTWS